MKFDFDKIKKQHHILPEYIKFLERLSKNSKVDRIIPGRISRQQKGTSHAIISFSYYTSTGLKFNLKKGSTVQELFVITSKGFENQVYNDIMQLIDFYGFKIK